MNGFEQRPNTVPWPPILFGAAFLIGVVLTYALPTPWIGPPLSDILFAIGWLTIAAAIFIDIRAMQTLSAGKTMIMPHKGSEHLVTSGPFSFSRNPIYLGNTMIMIGAALIAGSLWFIVLGLIAAFATQKLAIEREEQHLKARFGKRFLDYSKRVRRWI